jgi:hypothetical protein
MPAAKNRVWQVSRRLSVFALGIAAAAMGLRGPLAAEADESQPSTDTPKIALSGAAAFKSKQQALVPLVAEGGATDLDAVTEIWKKLRSSHENDRADGQAFAAALNRIEREEGEHSSDATKRESKPPRNYATTEAGAATEDAGKSTLDSLPDWSNEQLMAFAAAAIEHKKVYDAELNQRADILRKAARQIDTVAADLDAAEFDEQADVLFERAQALRYEARRVRAPQVPDFSARENDVESMRYNLHVLRCQLQLYRTEHEGQFPVALPDTHGRGTLHQLTMTTNAKGEIGEGPEFPHGPYLLSIPLNPLAETKHAAVVIAIDDWPPQDVQPSAGWLYHPPSGRIAPNSPGHLLD